MEQTAWGASGLGSICRATGASSSTLGWSSCPQDSGTHSLALFSPASGSPELVPRRLSILGGRGQAAHTQTGDTSNPWVCLPSPATQKLPGFVIFHNPQHGQQFKGGGEGAVIARGSGFHSIPPPFSTLLSGYRSALHSPFLQGFSSVLRLMSEHFPTPSWLSRSLDPSRQSCGVPSVHPNPPR